MAVSRNLIITSVFVMMACKITSSAPFSEERCKDACSRPIVDEELKTCGMCVNRVPINFRYCEDACVRDIEPICEICRDNFLKFVSGETCIYACETMNSLWMQMICIRCKRIPPRSPLLCDHACKAEDNYYFERICYWCQNIQSKENNK